MTADLSKFPKKLETENNPFYQHLTLRIDKSAAQKDFPIRFHSDLDVCDSHARTTSTSKESLRWAMNFSENTLGRPKSRHYLIIRSMAAQEADETRNKLIHQGDKQEAKKSREPSHSHQNSRATQKKPSVAKPHIEESKDQGLEVYSRRPVSANSNFTTISGLTHALGKDLAITTDDLIFKKYV